MFYSGVSHSMFGEMKTIEQENVSSSKTSSSALNSRGNSNFRDEDIDDDFDTVIRFNSGPPK